MKTSELKGAALDWAVAKCEGVENTWGKSHLKPYEYYKGHSYSTDWAHGGPIIEREKVTISYDYDQEEFVSDLLYVTEDNFYMEVGTTPLIAAMRCYVASKLGDEVEIPEELK